MTGFWRGFSYVGVDAIDDDGDPDYEATQLGAYLSNEDEILDPEGDAEASWTPAGGDDA